MNHPIAIQQRFSIHRPQLQNNRHISIGSATMFLTQTPNNVEYNVNVFPNGRSPAEVGRFLVFLQFKFPENIRINASFTFIVGGSKDKTFQHLFKSSTSFGGSICTLQQIFSPTSLLVNDKLSIELIGHVSIQKRPLNLPLSVRANLNYPFTSISRPSNSPKPKGDLRYRMPVPPKIVRKQKSFVENPKTETEINIARILQNHLEEERRTPKIAVKAVESNVKSIPKQISTNNENLTPAATIVVPKKIVENEAANKEQQTNVNELPSDIHEQPPRSPESHPNSETTASDIQQQKTDSSSSTATTTEEPNRNKRVRTRTSRYVEFVVEEDDMGEEPVTKKSRKRKSNTGVSPNTKSDGNDEYLPPRRSKSVARITTHIESSHPKIEYDCKIEGVEKIFDVNKKMLSQKSKGFETLFAANTESSFELEGIPDRTLEAAFNFCHGLPLKDMSNKECYSILFFADIFEMSELKSLCEERLVEKISLTNACDIANAAIMAKSEKLRNDCKKFFIENVRKNVSLRNYVALNKELKEEVLAAIAQSPQSE